MNLSLGQQWDQFLLELVNTGRYVSASEAVRDGLRLLEGLERKRLALKDFLGEAIAKGGAHSDAEVEAFLEDALQAWDKQQKPV
jgi:antitoxin ParD1/3/4